MRERYDDSPAAARESGLRRLRRLTWRTTQLGAVATVGFAIVFARTAPTPAANVKSVLPAEPTTTTIATPSQAHGQHSATPRSTASTRLATQPAGQPGVQQTAQGTAPKPATGPAPAPSSSRPLAPPTTAPAPAPTTSSASPVPTVTSTSHGGA